MNTKIVYVVVSSQSDFYLEQAWASVWSLKYYNPDAHVTFVVDDKTEISIKNETGRSNVLKLIDELLSFSFDDNISGKERSRILKTTLRERVKGDFLFIDTDTIITGPLDEVDNFSCHIGMVYDLHCNLSDYPFTDLIKREASYLYDVKLGNNTNLYNSGVIFVRDNQITRDFFNRWHENWKKTKLLTDFRDQPSLLKTCDETPNIVEPLSGIYNCQIIISIAYLYKAKIIHFYNNAWRKSDISPFLKNNLYLEIKKYGEITKRVEEMILNCKSEFYTPTMPVTMNEVQFSRSELYKYLLILFINHNKLFYFIDGFFKINKRIKKGFKILNYYVKERRIKKADSRTHS